MNSSSAQIQPSFHAGITRHPFSRWAVVACCVLLVGLFARLDGASDDVSAAVLYLVPVIAATWWAGRLSGWLVALVSLTACLMANDAGGPIGGHPLIPWWKAALPFVVCALIVELLAALQRMRDELESKVRWRSALLAREHSELIVARMSLVETESLASIGQLVVGVAHEVRNPLMTITMAADYFAQITPSTETEGTEMVRHLREAAERAGRAISEMAAIARPGPLALRTVDFHRLVEGALAHLKLEINRKHIVVYRERCKPAPQLRLDGDKMLRVLAGMFLDAIQAMPEGGTLALCSRIDETWFILTIDDTSSGLVEEGRGVLVESKPSGVVSDRGNPHVFSAARHIIKLHQGTLQLSNRPEGGARVTIRLPNTLRDSCP